MIVGTLLGVAGSAIPGVESTAEAGVVYVVRAPPPDRVEVRGEPPGPGVVWVPGYWAWNGADFTWTPGMWRAPEPGFRTWVPGHWRHDRRGWFWMEGHWR